MEPNFDKFYTENPEGISIASYQEISEILDALKALSLVFADASADGKFDLKDLERNAGALIDLFPKIKTAATFEYPIVVSSLTQSQISDMLLDVVEITRILAKAEFAGSDPATFKELKEVTNVLAKFAELFANFAKDGKIGIADFISNIGGILDLTSMVKLAVKFDGKISISNLTQGQVNELSTAIVSAVFSIVESAKKLK